MPFHFKFFDKYSKKKLDKLLPQLIAKGDLNAIKKIFDEKKDLDVNDFYGYQTLLLTACSEGKEKIVAFLLEHPNINVEKGMKSGRRPITVCFYSINGLACAKLLLKKTTITDNELYRYVFPISSLEVREFILIDMKHKQVSIDKLWYFLQGPIRAKSKLDLALIEIFKANPGVAEDFLRTAKLEHNTEAITWLSASLDLINQHKIAVVDDFSGLDFSTDLCKHAHAPRRS